MELVNRTARAEKKPKERETIARLREAGETLENLLVRYDRLVARLTGGRPRGSDFLGQIEWLNLQLAAAAEDIQELIVLEPRRSRAVALRRETGGPRAAPRPFVVRRAAEGRA